MGRHETFDTAIPIADELLSGTAFARHGAHAEAAPDRRALVAYASWLHGERAHLCKELYPHLGWKASHFIVGDNAGFDYQRTGAPLPSTRAIAVLEAVGCDWTNDSYLGVGDGGEAHPEASAFPHPDGRLLDLERDWRAARDIYDEIRAREIAALAKFERLEEPFVEAEDGLLMRPPRRMEHTGRLIRDHWQGKHIRQILAGRFMAATSKDADRIDATPRAEFERLLPLVEAREARRDALSERLGLERLEAEAEHALDVVDEAAKRVYRLRAATFEGLALKARVLRTQEPDLWKRPDFLDRGPRPEWHEVALTEIADGVEHLLKHGAATARTSTFSDSDLVTDEGGLTVDLYMMSGAVAND